MKNRKILPIRKLTNILVILFILSSNAIAQSPGEWFSAGPPGTDPRIRNLYADPDNPSNLYASTESSGVYFSKDAANSWQRANAPMDDKQVNAFIVDNGNVYAGAEGYGVFKSSDGGANWLQANASMDSLSVTSITSFKGMIIAGTRNFGILYSMDGLDWFQANVFMDSLTVTALTATDEMIIAGTAGFGVFQSTDGINWLPANAPMNDKIVNTLISLGDTLYAGTSGAGVFFSVDGIDWIQANEPINIGIVKILISMNNTLYAVVLGGFEDSIYQSADGGVEWTPINAPASNRIVTSLISVDDVLVAATEGCILCVPEPAEIYYSSDGGSSWTLALQLSSRNDEASIMIEADGNLYAGTLMSGLFRSSNHGRHWFNTSHIIPANLSDIILDVNFVATYGEDGVFVSTDAGENWQRASQTIDTTSVTSMTYSIETNKLYAGTFGFSNSTGMYISSDGGLNWASIRVQNEVLTRPIVNKLFLIKEDNSNTTEILFTVLGGHVIIRDGQPVFCENPRGLYRSVGGEQWKKTVISETSNIRAMILDGARLYAGSGSGEGIFWSNDGERWMSVNTTIENPITALASYKQTVYAGTDGMGIFRSENGLDWQPVGGELDNKQITVIIAANDMIYAGTNGFGVFHSADGISWIHANAPMNDKSVASIDIVNNVVYAGTLENGVFRSIDGGNDWTPLITGMGVPSVRKLAHLSTLNRLYAVTDNGVYFQTLDTDAPIAHSIGLASATKFTPQRDIRLSLFVSDADSMRLSEDASFSNSGWQPFQESASFALSDGDGVKTVYAKFKDISANESEVINTEIRLDATSPVFQQHTPPSATNLGSSVSITQQVTETNLETMRLFFDEAAKNGMMIFAQHSRGRMR